MEVTDYNRPLRLCFIADPRSVHTVRWLRFFIERGHQVALICQHAPASDLGLTGYYPLSEQSSLPGTRLLRNVFEVRRAIRDFRPDILHAHYINECGWLGALSGFHPFVLTAWGSDVYLAPQQSRLAHYLTPWSVRRADYVTADSSDQIARLRAMGGSGQVTETINWGVDLAQFSRDGGAEWREKYGVGSQRVVILSPRNWTANSNIETIIEAFAVVRVAQPNALLALKYQAHTPAKMREAIQAQVVALGLEDTTLVIGEIPSEQLPGMYAAADITVSVCSSDGTPVSVLEAMASRSAVIAGDLPSLAEWVEEGVTGLCVAPRDAAVLARQMLRLVGDSELRRVLGANGRSLVEQKGDRAKNLRQIEVMYRRLRKLRRKSDFGWARFSFGRASR